MISSFSTLSSNHKIDFANKYYKLSMFNIYINLDDNTIGVYNTLHDSAVALDIATANMILDNNLGDDNKILNSLLDAKLIVTFDFKEEQYFEYYLNKMKYSPTHASFVFCLTSDCNLSCPYCFEGLDKSKKYMSSKSAVQAVEFISAQYKKNRSIDNLYVTFFGGEPLLNRKIMQKVCKEISRTEAIRDKVKYILTSNLTLLKEVDIEFMKQYQFLNVQVAIDGVKDVHNARRNFESGKGTFDIVVRNIQMLVENDFYVTIFLNFDQEGEKRFDELIHFIKSSLPYEQLEFVLNPITKSLCNRNCDLAFLDHDQESDVFLNIYHDLKLNGIKVESFGQRGMLCMLNTDVSCIIDPSGVIYKCCLMLGIPKYKAGSIYNGFQSSKNFELLTEEPWRPCLEEACVYLPICGGGCRSVALMETGKLKSLHCRKEDYYEKVFPILLKDHLNDLLEGGDKK